jgi:hypothetical protein
MRRDPDSKITKKAVFDYQEGRCYYCQHPMNTEDPLDPRYVTWEHKIPWKKWKRKRGGKTKHRFRGLEKYIYLALACHQCNNAKGDMHEEKFRRKMGYMGPFIVDSNGDIIPAWVRHNPKQAVKEAIQAYELSRYQNTPTSRRNGAISEPRQQHDTPD